MTGPFLDEGAGSCVKECAFMYARDRVCGRSGASRAVPEAHVRTADHAC